MSIKRVIQSVVVISIILMASIASAQYEEDPYIEGFIGANLTIPTGYIKNDLDPDSLNAKTGIGLDIGAGYYFSYHFVAGLYFNARNLGVKDFDLNHRMFEVGLYGKYLVMNLSEKSISPYLKLSAGLNFSKLASRVIDDGQPVIRELAYQPALASAIGLGLHWKTNERGGVYLEASYQLDVMNDATGKFESVDYTWGDNNNFILIKAGVIFNIGPRE